jgi:hypothetical protein
VNYQMSNELSTFGPQVFVEPYPPNGVKYQLRTDGAGEPVWSPSGKELFYSWNGKLYGVGVETQPTFAFGTPSPLPIAGLEQGVGNPQNYDISPDGRQFVVLPASQGQSNQPATPQINVVLTGCRNSNNVCEYKLHRHPGRR